MIYADLSPKLILPDYWEAKRPAIIRPVDDELKKAMPVSSVGFFTKNKTPPSITFGSSTQLSSSGTTVTWSGVSIGTASPTRLVVACLYTLTGTVTGCTIGGVTATLGIDGSQTSWGGSYIYYAVVPTGTTANIVFTLAAANTAVPLSYWYLDGLNSNTPSTQGVTRAASNATRNLTMTVPDKGYAILNASGGANVTPTNYTERYDVKYTTVTSFYEGGDYNNVSGSSTSRTFTAASSVSSLCGVVWV